MQNRSHAGEQKAQPLIVLLSFPPSKPQGNPYRTLLECSLRDADGVSVESFRYRTALFGRYDVFHVHWPEILVTGRSPLRKMIRQLLFALLLLRLRLFRVPIVRTVHNTELPKGISRLERLLLLAADQQVALRIRINKSTRLDGQRPNVTVLHGHYREWFSRYEVRATVPGRLVFFGLIRRYKGVDDLLHAFRDINPSEAEVSLVVVGKPSTSALAQSLTEQAMGDDRITMRLSFVEDAELATLVGEAELVILPYKEMHNSAGVLTALSLGRPVLIPENPVNKSLSEEVGPGWVHMYSGKLDGPAIVEALRRLRACSPQRPPDLSQRDWKQAAAQHVAAYRTAAQVNARLDSTP